MQVPIVIRGPGGVGRQLGAEHSQRLESYFQSIPGVQLVACSTVANAKALLKSAIRSDNPIIFFEHVLLYNVKGNHHPPSLSFPLYALSCAGLQALRTICVVACVYAWQSEWSMHDNQSDAAFESPPLCSGRRLMNSKLHLLTCNMVMSWIIVQI